MKIPGSTIEKQGIVKAAVRNKDNIERLEAITLRKGRQPIKAWIYYVAHNDKPKETYLKVYRENNAGSDVHEATVTIKDAEINQLVEYIQQAGIVKDLPKGKYLTVPIDGTGISLTGQDPTAATKALMAVMAEPEIMKHVHEAEIPVQLVNAIRLGYRLQTMKAGISELKTLLQAEKHREQDYQNWIQKYSWGLGSQFVSLEKIRQFDRKHKLDALVKGYTGYCDAIELKLPNMPVISFDKDHDSYFFSRDTSMAIGQTAAYVEKLHDEARRGLEREEHIKAFYPHGTIVIGRSDTWDDKQHQALQLLNGHQHRIRVITYDHLLKIAENLIQQLDNQSEE